ncbi:hypothetical protein BHU62_11445 [Serratia marcescens]|uniref:Uncharacterized protein n=1 Tax=Serratia marcescens TaxID=615 RepID=A0A1Q4P051_SERMA|nr:hypothetical protein BHU62_11445 [Serratia marcescens]
MNVSALISAYEKSIVTIGGGVIGQATVQALIKNGYEGPLLERSRQPVRVAGFTNGGQLSDRRVAAFADGGAPLQGLKRMGKAGSPLNMRLWTSFSQCSGM